MAKSVQDILNIIKETIDHLLALGVHRFGLLATEGTVLSRSYHRLCEPLGTRHYDAGAGRT